MIQDVVSNNDSLEATSLSNINSSQTYSLVGTAEYVSPEALNKDKSFLNDSFGADLWALGCIIYRFFEGATPFSETSEKDIFNHILNQEEIRFNDNTPTEARDLITKLLNKKASDRIGFSNFEELKQHVFFSSIDFSNIKDLMPPNESIIQLMTSRLRNSLSHSKLATSSNFKAIHIINEQKEKENEETRALSSLDVISESKEEQILNSHEVKRPKMSNNIDLKTKKMRRFSEDTLVLECKVIFK